jgi:S1-C subfamily serine protease
MRMPHFHIALIVAIAILARCSHGIGMDLVDVVANVEQSVVRVDTDSGFGSGVIVGDRGAILTNFHVIEGARRVKIILRSGKELESQGYLAVDPTHDLALLQVDKLPERAAIKVASTLPKIGEKAAAFGNPKGFSFTTSEGIVSAVRSGTEVINIISAEAYRHLGYAADATWIHDRR